MLQPQHRPPLPAEQVPEPCGASEKSPVNTQLMEARSPSLTRLRLFHESPWEARHVGSGVYNHYRSQPVAAPVAVWSYPL